MDLSALPDPVIHPNALKVLNKQNYCWPRPDGTRETPREMFERVAKFVGDAERIWGGRADIQTEKLYTAMTEGKFIFNTPAMVNAGKDNGMLSACFVLPLEDSTADIYSTVRAAAMVQTAGGGTGHDGSHLRCRNSVVGSTGKVSGGSMSTLRLLNASSKEFITQGSARKGANMYQINCLHADVEEFIDIKTIDGELSEFNISVAITDSFMQAVKLDAEWKLYDPKGIPVDAWKIKTFEQLTPQMRVVKTVKARDLWHKIIYNAWKFGGDPGAFFIDTTNSTNPTPHIGQFSATNPCFAGDTRIATENGLIEIRDLVRNKSAKYARTMDGYEPIIAYYDNGIKQTVKVTTNFGYTLTVTADHKWDTNAGKKETKDLIIGDIVTTSDGLDSIVSIVQDATQEVFNLTVDPSHHVWANGIYIPQCGEQPLLPYEACVLGHVNLAQFHKAGEDELYQAFYNGTRWLDNVVEVNYYPLPEIEAMHKNGNRKVGVGVLGFANMLAKLGVPYDTEHARKIARKIGKVWEEATDQASVDMAKTRGSFNNFKGSALEAKFPDGIRNACRRTIAPTGSTSIIIPPNPESTGIEPIFGLVQSRNQAGMQMFDVNYVFDDYLKSNGIVGSSRDAVLQHVSDRGTLQGCNIVPESAWEIFKQANDISPENHVLMQAAYQIYNDSATSKTINLAKNATYGDVEKAYWLAWETKCKGITVYVDGSRKGQPLTVGQKTDVTIQEIDPKHEIVSKFKQLNGHTLDVAKEIVALLTPEQIAQLGLQQVTIDVPASKLGRDRSHVTQGTGRKMETGCGNAFIFLGQNADGGLDDVVGRLGKSGGCASAFWEGLSRVTSIALRHGVSIDEIRKQLTGISCHRPAFHHTPGQEKPDTITSCADGLATALYEFQLEQTKANQTMPPAALIEAKAVGGDQIEARATQPIHAIMHIGACPSCYGNQLDYGSGCALCRSCGWSQC